jgi:hypothetical protein
MGDSTADHKKRTANHDRILAVTAVAVGNPHGVVGNEKETPKRAIENAICVLDDGPFRSTSHHSFRDVIQCARLIIHVSTSK